MDIERQSTAALTSTAPERHRFHLLDGLRGVAAVLVVLYHVPLVLRPWLPNFNGWLAVDFFFCLSGFVIVFSYEDKLLSGMSLGRFLVVRLIRLYPLYFFGLLLGTVSSIISARAGILLGVSIREILLVSLTGFLLVPNIAIHWPIPYCFPLDVPAWSLFLEILANVAFAVWVRLRLATTAFFIVMSVLCLGLWVRAAASVGQNLHLGYEIPTFAVGLARVGSSFCLGVVVFRLYVYAGRPRSSGKARWILPVVATAALVGALVNPFSFSSSLLYQAVTIAILFPATVLVGACCALPRRFHKLCTFLGEFSYPLYILHSPIIGPLTGRKVQVLLPRYGIPSLIAISIICVCLIIVAHIAGKGDSIIRRKLTLMFSPRAAGPAKVHSISEQLFTMDDSRPDEAT